MVERIVITGMGAISPIGLSVAEAWNNATNGVSGVGPITLFDAAGLGVRIACEVKDFHPEHYMDHKEARRRDRFEQFAIAAAKEAMAQSGLEIGEADSHRIGTVISSSIGGIATVSQAMTTLLQEGPRRVSPFTIPMLMANGASGLTAIDLGLRGPSFSVSSACASGADAIGMAWLMLRAGIVDAVVAGASEAPITEIGVACFDRVGAMSRRNDDYSMTPAPFDLNRDGFVMGEGAAVMVLEPESRARRRGAEIIAEVAGYAATADAYHITAPKEDGAGGAAAIRMAVASAELNLEDVDYVNAHGTATGLNDAAETRALKTVFGQTAYRIPISSTKSMTGHMMGATGALEAVFCALAVKNGCIPPTIHYQTPDPDCDLDYTPNLARSIDVRAAISNAFGFGGHNAVLVLRRYG